MNDKWSGNECVFIFLFFNNIFYLLVINLSVQFLQTFILFANKLEKKLILLSSVSTN